MSRQQYDEIRTHPQNFDPYLVGCAGFLASYRAKFFGGYAGKTQTQAGPVRDYYDEAKRNLLKQAEGFNGISFACMDYRRVDFHGCAIYCDPPYLATTGYHGEPFDHTEFWDTVRRWSRDNTVFVSEQQAPDDFTCVWEGSLTRSMDGISRPIGAEKLFIYDGRKHSYDGRKHVIKYGCHNLVTPNLI